MGWLIPIILTIFIVLDITFHIDSKKLLDDKGFFFNEDEDD